MSQAQTKADENGRNLTSDDLGALCDELTANQIRFVTARQDYSTDKDAAQAVGISPSTVKDWKYKGVPIDAAVELMAKDGLVVARKVRQRNIAKAMLVKVAGLDSNDERLRQGVATEIIEWEMGKATQKQQLTGKDDGPIETRTKVDISDVLAILPGGLRAAVCAELGGIISETRDSGGAEPGT